MTRTSLGRARLSCIPCRLRKSKCNEQTPCTSCNLRGTVDKCRLPEASSSASPKQDLPASESVSHLYKKRRLSPSNERHSSGPFAEIEELRNGLTRLEDSLKIQPLPASDTWSCSTLNAGFLSDSLLPERLDQIRIDAILAVFPCQSDCEILFEYLLQEADWLVNCIDVQWLHSIWCRFVYGARVTIAESEILVAALAVAALLLDEGPHIYYQLSTSLYSLHIALVDFLYDCLVAKDARLEKMSLASFSSRNVIDELLVVGLTGDYLRFQGQRKLECWPLTKKLLHRWVKATNILDGKSEFWHDLNESEIQCAQRLIRHAAVNERWISIYEPKTSDNPFFKSNINLPTPKFENTGLSAPFKAIHWNDKEYSPLCFRLPEKHVPRLFRLKGEHEKEEVKLFSDLFLGLASHCLAISDYCSAIEAWRENNTALDGEGGGGLVGSTDHRREALLHQGFAICSEMKHWQNRIEPICSEEDSLDPNDYFACRKASQIALVHVGRRQLLNIVLSAWVTEESLMEMDSPLLTQLQRQAFDNAKDAVRSVNVSRALLSCGKVLQISWAALAIFNAAVTLATPLLSASRLKESSSSQRMTKSYPRVFRLDKVPDLSEMDDNTPRQAPTPDDLPFYPGNSSNDSNITTPGYTASKSNSFSSMSSQLVLSMEELRGLAPDILRILELLPHFKTRLLSSEARQRLAKLVDTYGIGHKQFYGSGPDATILSSLDTLQDANEYSAALVEDPKGFAVLDSLIALDDTWWEQFLSSKA